MTALTSWDIAEACHEANRVLQRALGEPISPLWVETDSELRESIRDGVLGALGGVMPESSHENWLEFKRAHGWVWGPVKDTVNKTHPNMVPYEALPEEQQLKDHLFLAIVRELSVFYDPTRG